MTDDLCRAPTGLATAEALGDWNRMATSFLAHGAAAPEHLRRVLEREPEAALPLAAQGLFCLMLGRRETVAAAGASASAARRALDMGGAPPANKSDKSLFLRDFSGSRIIYRPSRRPMPKSCKKNPDAGKEQNRAGVAHT